MIVTFILELPRDVPIPHDWAIAPFAGRTAAWDGWTGDDLKLLASGPQAFPEHLVPGTRALFRRADVKTALPLRAADAAFADWVKPLLSRREKAQRWWGLRKATRVGLRSSRCVVALSSFVPVQEAPDELELDKPLDWIRSQFYLALAPLNSYLSALGMMSNDWRVGPVSIGDLPPFMPIIFDEVQAGAEPGKKASHFVVSIRPDLPDYAGRPEPSVEVATRAAAIVNSANRGMEPYLEVFRLLRDAWAHGLTGEPNRCVITLGTGVELLVSTTVREAGSRAGWDERRIDSALNPLIGLKRRVVEHLSSLLGETIDVDSTNDPWGRWWKTAYRMRNEAAHEGAAISAEEAVEAKAMTAALLREVRRALAARTEFTDLAQALHLDLEIHDYQWQFVSILPATI